MKSGTTKWLIIGAIGAGIAWFLLGKPHSIQAAESGFNSILHGDTSHANYGGHGGWGGGGGFHGGGFHGGGGFGGFHGGWGGPRGYGFARAFGPGYGYGYGFPGGYPPPYSPFPQVPGFGFGGGPFGYGRPHHLGGRFM